MLGTWQATRPASSLTDSSPTDSDSSTHSRFGSASARPTTAVRSYSDSRFCLSVERAASSTATLELLHDLRNRASLRSSAGPPVCSRPMPEIEGAPPQPELPPPQRVPPAPPQPDLPPPGPDAAPPAGPPYLPFGAYARPSILAAVKPAWTRTYELPSARQVVNAGLHLAQGSSRAIRRAS